MPRLALEWTVALYDAIPLARFRLRVVNHATERVLVHDLSPLAVDADIDAAAALDLGAGSTPDNWSFYREGYQSWSPALTLRSDETFKLSWSTLSRSITSNPASDQPGRPGRFAGEWVGAVQDRTTAGAIIIGFLTMKKYFSRIEYASPKGKRFKRLVATNQVDALALDPGAALASEPAAAALATDLGAAFERYATATATMMAARPQPRPPTVWCSWYYFYTDITEAAMLENLDTLAEYRDRLGLPIEIVQLDDGYQAGIGDWLEQNEKFPHGLKWLAQRIKEKGFRPGLWLAPFLVTTAAAIYREHPDWLLCDAKGKPVKAGWNPMWPGKVYTLDVTKPAVKAWLQRVFRTITHEWGFEYLKLDFLYGACIGAHFSEPMPRCGALRGALELIRAAVGDDVLIEGCGAPLGPMIGIADTMRIACDTAPYWTDRKLKLIREEGGPTLKYSLRNGMTRFWMHQRFWTNHQDCLLVRDTDTKLTEAEVRSMVTVVALTGVMVVMSDDMPKLAEHRRQYLERVLPVYGRAGVPLDLFEHRMPRRVRQAIEPKAGFDRWWSVGLFNWSDRQRDIKVRLDDLVRTTTTAPSPAQYHVFDFWNDEYLGLRSGPAPIELTAVPAHGCALLGLRRVRKHPWLLATTLHYTMGGVEVSRCEFDPARNRLTITLEKPGRQHGALYLSLPRGWRFLGAQTATGPAVRAERRERPAPHLRCALEFQSKETFVFDFDHA